MVAWGMQPTHVKPNAKGILRTYHVGPPPDSTTEQEKAMKTKTKVNAGKEDGYLYYLDKDGDRP